MAKYRKDEIPKLCRNCKWWIVCDRDIDNVGECEKVANNVWASNIDSIELITTKDFGCIHWEGK